MISKIKTVTDLPKSPQEIFDAVVTHFKSMEEPAMNSGYECAYRGTNDSCCFVGALIPDALYSESMEGCIGELIGYLFDTGTKDNEILGDFINSNTRMLNELQCIHDATIGRDRWKTTATDSLMEYAKTHDFNTEILEGVI